MKIQILVFSLRIILIALALVITPPIGKADSAPSFEKDVRPLFEKHCLSCHSSQIHSSGLVLETPESISQGGSLNGPAVIPGKSGESPLIRYLRGEKKPTMPMGKA